MLVTLAHVNVITAYRELHLYVWSTNVGKTRAGNSKTCNVTITEQRDTFGHKKKRKINLLYNQSIVHQLSGVSKIYTNSISINIDSKKNIWIEYHVTWKPSWLFAIYSGDTCFDVAIQLNYSKLNDDGSACFTCYCVMNRDRIR